MPCYFPLKAYRAKSKDPQKTLITFRRSESWGPTNHVIELALPCGQCIGCRLERSRQWALRCVHEASLYEENSFLTLTYSPENLPSDKSLHLEHFQKFMKRLRKSLAPKKVRFYHCGEYGEQLARPHYHALLFNYCPPDLRHFSGSGKTKVSTSESLSQLWPYGYAVVGEVTFESAAYVARYVMKKINGPNADVHYMGMKPEYTTMSRRPGIGKGWYEKFKTDVYPHDRIMLRGVRSRPPRYYDGLLLKEDPSTMAFLKLKRSENEKFVKDTLSNGKVIVVSDSSDQRLAVKHLVKQAEISNLKRPLEDNSHGI
ncbi:replication initiator protein [Blackfly microvirus SF02]|uniref:Replication initiator protein n=1 Tax=Blackfly microvirus SF02 TaxID=2576452 RepID=A0A4P8PK42_9VIRU|nr:replication initiator protein [Blackfly microvirus SF02]